MGWTNKKDVSSRRVGTLEPPSNTKPLSKEICNDHIDTTWKKILFRSAYTSPGPCSLPYSLPSCVRLETPPHPDNTCMHLHMCISRRTNTQKKAKSNTHTHTQAMFNLSSDSLHLSLSLNPTVIPQHPTHTHTLNGCRPPTLYAVAALLKPGCSEISATQNDVCW